MKENKLNKSYLYIYKKITQPLKKKKHQDKVETSLKI